MYKSIMRAGWALSLTLSLTNSYCFGKCILKAQNAMGVAYWLMGTLKDWRRRGMLYYGYVMGNRGATFNMFIERCMRD